MRFEVEPSGESGRIEALASTLLGPLNVRGRFAAGLHTFLVFGIRQAWVCLFGGLMIALLVGTHLWYPVNFPLPRYDALTLSAIVILCSARTRTRTSRPASLMRETCATRSCRSRSNHRHFRSG